MPAVKSTPYKSRSVPFRNLATSKDPNARMLHVILSNHPAREHIHLGPLWVTIYMEHKKSSLNIPMARKTATLAVLEVMNKIGYALNPISFIPITLGVYKP